MRQPIVVTETEERRGWTNSRFNPLPAGSKHKPRAAVPSKSTSQNSLTEEQRFSALQTQTHSHKMSNKEMISVPKGLLLKSETRDKG